MRRISLESSPWRREVMSEESLRDLQEVSEHLSMLISQDGLSLVLTSSRQDVRSSIFNHVELVVSLVVRLVTLMTFLTSTDLDTQRLNLSRK